MAVPVSSSTYRSFLVATTGLILAAAAAVATHRPPGAGAILGTASAAFDGLVALGAALGALGRHLDVVRPVLGLAALCFLVAARGAGGWLAAALCLAAAAQSYLLDQRPGVGTLLYALAAVAVVRRPPRPAPSPGLHPAVELPATVVLLAVFVFGCLYALDLRPDLGWDEFGFATAARMQLGDIPAGRVLIYRLARFQGEPVPLALHILAFAGLDAGIVSVRLVSLGAATVALALAALAVRGRLGAPAALCALGLAAFTPLQLAYGRLAEYVIVSVPHAALTFAVLLRLHDRPRWTTAAVLGVLLGSSLYFYQASWFVPFLVAGTLMVWPQWWRVRHAPALAALALGTALVTVVPGFTLLRHELAAVAEQSFDRAVWLERPLAGGDHALVVLLPPDRAAEAGLESVIATLADRGVTATVAPLQDHRALVLGGPRDRVRAVRDELRSWSQLRQMNLERWTAWDNLVDVLRRLFCQPSLDLTLIDVPILNPVVAPLLVLGLAEAARRWRVPAARALAVWAVGGAVLPSMIAGVFPRRMVLMLPFAYVLAALPVVELAGVAGVRLGWSRIAAVGGAAVLVVAVASTNAALYFRHWDWAGAQGGVSKLGLLRLLETLPPEEVVLLPQLFPSVTGEGVADYWRVLYPHRPPRRLVVMPDDTADEHEVRRLSCAQPPPFTWIVAAAPAKSAAAVRAGLGAFRHGTEMRGPFAIVRVLDRTEDACR